MNKIKNILLMLILLFSFNVYADVETEDYYEFTDSEVLESTDNDDEVDVLVKSDIIYENSNGYVAKINDNSDLLTDEEENNLKEIMIKLTEFGNIEFLSSSDHLGTTVSYIEDYYYRNYSNNSGTIFFIDMKNRQIYICSDGYNYTIINDSKSNIITDNTYKYATNGNYYLCVLKSYEQMYTLLNGGKISEPMRYISAGLLSLSLGCMFSFIFITSKSKFKSYKVKDIINNCYKKVMVSDFTYTKTGTHSVYSPPVDTSSDGGSSGGGSSGGGSSGGGGGFSGGGGGHSF